MSPLSHLRILVAFVLSFFIPNLPLGHAQTIEELKAGVVKIKATVDKRPRVGTGFIVKIEDDTAYIITASHVVEGASLAISFYPKPDKPYPGEMKAMDGGNPKGLAVVLVRGSLPKGVRPLMLGSNVAIKGGEPITLIGFPRAIGVPWAIASGIIAGQKGLDLIITGSAVQEGNSGGPILLNDRVVGVLTEIQTDFGYGVPSSITRIALQGWGVRVETVDLAQEITSKDGAPETKQIGPLPPAEPILNISGVWRDSHDARNVTQISQDGNSYHFTRKGVFPNGTRFESVGSGTITGLRFTSTYKATLLLGITSVGDCAGTYSPDGRRSDTNCRDSLLGAFSVTAFRQ